MRAPSVLTLLAGLAGLTGCGASPPPPAASLDDKFAAIQVHEARIEHARATVQNEASECAEVCAAARDAQGSASELCAIARQAADPDALTRCEAATHGAASIQAQAVQRCGCGERAP